MNFPFRPNALKPRSIAFRLIVAVLAVELMSAILVVVLSFGYERHMHFHAYDVLLHGHVDSILGAVQESNDGQDGVMLVQADLHLPPNDVYEVFGADGKLLGRSANWQGIALVPQGPPWGTYFNQTINDHEYRMLQFNGTRLVDPGDRDGGKLRKFTVVYGGRTHRVWESIWGTVEFYGAGSALLLLVTGPLIAWLLHRGLLPLRELAAQASGVSVNSWNFDPPESAHTTPELAPLTQAVESVLQRLEASFVQQRVFVSDAAHELKTAVAVVKSSLQLLGLRKRSIEEYKAGLERCLSDCQRLEEIVGKMLTLAREESIAPHSGPVATSDLADSLRQTLDQLHTAAELRGVKMELLLPEEPEALVALSNDDCDLLFLNLLLNALQHSPTETEIATRMIIKEPRWVSVEIEDHGDGIAPESLPHVFDRFYRGDPSRTRNTGGTGLGLAIAKAVAERAGGAIVLSSQSGVGTTVTVRLPLASVLADQA
jgi:signal transduction histidine kinase